MAISPELRTLLHQHRQRELSGDKATTSIAPVDVARLLELVGQQATGAPIPPMPQHESAKAVAAALLDDPADRRTLEQWARVVHVGPKTLQRAFGAETGRTFSAWRTEVRLHAAVALLDDGRTVTSVAHAVGYDTPSGLISAYRRAFGHTPGSRATG